MKKKNWFENFHGNLNADNISSVRIWNFSWIFLKFVRIKQRQVRNKNVLQKTSKGKRRQRKRRKYIEKETITKTLKNSKNLNWFIKSPKEKRRTRRNSSRQQPQEKFNIQQQQLKRKKLFLCFAADWDWE